MSNHAVVRAWILLILAVSASPARAFVDYREEFAKLESEMQSAVEAYFNALEEQHAKREGAPQDSPPPSDAPDGRIAVLKKMDALTATAGDSPDAAFIALNTFFWSVGVQPESLLERFEKLAAKHPDEGELVEFLIAVPDLYADSGTADKWIAALEKLAKATKEGEVRTASNFGIARIHLKTGKQAQAKQMFEQVVKTTENPDAARAAKGFINEIEHLQIGMVAPDFETKTLDGKTVALKSLRGKVVLLNFWATWCAPCITEIPTLQDLSKRFAGKPFEILSISLDDSKEALTGLLNVKPVPGIHTWDEKGPENPVSETYNVQALPALFVLDHRGAIRHRDPKPEELLKLIEPLVEAAPRDAAAPEKPEPAKKP